MRIIMAEDDMNSRERILAAVEHREPDRVPIDLGGTPSSGISAIAYNKLKDRFGMDEPTLIYDVVQQLAQPSDAMLDRLGVDVVDVGRLFNTSPSDWADMNLTDGSAARYPAWFRPEPKPAGGWIGRSSDGTAVAEMPATGTFFDQTYFPYKDGYPADYAGLDEEMGKVLWATFVHSPWDQVNDEGFWYTLRERTSALRQSTDRALLIVVGCNLFEWGTFLRRMDNFLMDLMLEQEQVARLLDELMKRHLAFLEKVCTAVGDLVAIMRLGDDLGMDKGPFMPPDTYRKLFKPCHTELCDFVHKHSRAKTFLHSCGSIHALLPDLIEAGFDIINPVQTNCRDMEPERLKREFGKEITFWGGGCDTRKVLNLAKPEEVKTHVRERLDVFAPGGGFVFNTVHNILPDVPPENVEAMFEALQEYGG